MKPMSASENNKEVEEVTEISESKDARIYELGYLLVPTVVEENVPAVYGNLKELISSFKGGFISDDMPRSIPLAYTMSKVISNVRHKFNTAYFGWVKFEMDAEKILELKKKLDLDPQILRFLILKTVKENTIAAKRFVSREGGVARKIFTAKKEGEPEVVAPINKEEIDKEIDAMVAV